VYITAVVRLVRAAIVFAMILFATYRRIGCSFSAPADSRGLLAVGSPVGCLVPMRSPRFLAAVSPGNCRGAPVSY